MYVDDTAWPSRHQRLGRKGALKIVHTERKVNHRSEDPFITVCPDFFSHR
jgi:hypothetical protein